MTEIKHDHSFELKGVPLRETPLGMRRRVDMSVMLRRLGEMSQEEIERNVAEAVEKIGSGGENKDREMALKIFMELIKKIPDENPIFGQKGDIKGKIKKNYQQ